MDFSFPGGSPVKPKEDTPIVIDCKGDDSGLLAKFQCSKLTVAHLKLAGVPGRCRWEGHGGPELHVFPGPRVDALEWHRLARQAEGASMLFLGPGVGGNGAGARNRRRAASRDRG